MNDENRHKTYSCIFENLYLYLIVLLNLEQTTDLQDTLFYLDSQILAMKKNYATRNIPDFVYLMLCLSFDFGFLFCFALFLGQIHVIKCGKYSLSSSFCLYTVNKIQRKINKRIRWIGTWLKSFSHLKQNKII